MKMIVTIIPTDIVTNSLLSSFYPFLQTKNKNQIFSKSVVWQPEILLFLVYTESNAMSNLADFYKRIFLRVNPVCIVGP